jgi:hypothetical protein
LEVKEKSYAQQIAMLESQLNELSRERENRERERQVVHQRLAEAQRIIDTMQDEKRELIMRHNEEASQLRRKVQILTDQLEAGPAPAMSAAPSSTGFTDFNEEMEALTMAPHDWDNFIFVNDLQNDGQTEYCFSGKPDQPAKPAPTLEKKSSSATITQSTQKRDANAVNDQPIASGLLFMLLLCGAWIASKPVNSQPSDLPNMPQEVREAAPTILSNLLSECNGASGLESGHNLGKMGCEPTTTSGTVQGEKRSKLDRMHRTLTSPTKQQEIDQAFALTQAQYASMTNMDYPAYSQRAVDDAAPPQRRVLAEALANLEQDQTRNNKAEVYTRSLLWDQIPADVVRQFKEIVRDHSEIEARQQQQQQQQQQPQKRKASHDATYKLEK